MIKSCYDTPNFYELAFSFRDIAAEVAVIKSTVDLFSKRDTKRILQLACGPSQHMIELSHAGLFYVGIDINKAMLDHSASIAIENNIKVELYEQNMVNYKIDTPVDYVFIALGDIYVSSNFELNSLFISIAESLNPGGLVLLDWCIQFQPESFFDPDGQSWSISHESIRVDSHVVMTPIDRAEQTFTEKLVLNVTDGEKKHRFESSSVKRAIFPQEFLLLIDSLKEFEFIGWWNNWDMTQPISSETKDFFRPITLLRRR